MTTPTAPPSSTPESSPPTTEQQPIGCCLSTGDPDIDGTTTTTTTAVAVELPVTGAGELGAVAALVLAAGAVLAAIARRRPT